MSCYFLCGGKVIKSPKFARSWVKEVSKLEKFSLSPGKHLQGRHAVR